MKFAHLLFFLLCMGCYLGEELQPDQTIWPYDVPGAHQLIQESLIDIDNSISAKNFQTIEGLIIIKDDHLVFENYYANGASRDYLKNIGSSGLSITHAAVGIALDQRIINLDDPIAMYLPSYNYVFVDDPVKADITIRHLLSHRSGISWNESILGYFDPQNDLNQMKASDDWVRFVLTQPLESPPGLRFSFNTAGGLLLAKIIEHAANQSYQDYLEENLFQPLTIEEYVIVQDPMGSFNGGDGYQLSLIDWTKLSYLYLKNGLWNGRRVLDPDFIETSTLPLYEISSNEKLGLLWSLFGDHFQNRLGIDHHNIYYMLGELGQSVFIIPSENMIVSILADNFFNFNNLSVNLFSEITFTIETAQ